MSAGPTSSQIASAKASALRRFQQDFCKALGHGLEFHNRVAIYRGARVTLAFKVIHASNGEAAGWVTATVDNLMLGERSKASIFISPPWLGGATPENVAAVMRLYAHE